MRSGNLRVVVVFDLSFRSFLGCVVLAALLWTKPAAGDDAISEEAKLYFKNGVELIQSQPPNYQDAYYQFKLAWEKSRSWKVLSNWGLCALKLERDGEAIWAYTEYLARSGQDIDPDERKYLERDLLLLNGNAASVSISSDVPDLEVIDARAGSVVPPQSYRLEGGQLALRLRAGSHSLTASSQGKLLKWEVTLSPGRTEAHRFEFAAATAATANAAAPPATAAAAPVTTAPGARPVTDVAPSRGGTVRNIGYLVTGAGLLALGAGIFTGAQTKNEESELREKCETLPGYGFSCPRSVESDFEELEGRTSLANVLMIGGGVVSAGGLAMIIWGGPRTSASAGGWQLTPVAGVGEAGLFASGSF
jgi:hypothetical protein